MKNKFNKWINDSQTWGFFLSVAIMAAVSLLFFFPDSIQDHSLQQADMAQGLANGHETQVYQAETGKKALWTGSLFSGMPTFQISPSYASNALFGWINKLYGLFLPEPSNLVFMMMIGFFIMLYCMRVRWWIALIGSIAWAFSSYYIIIIGAGHIWKLLTLSYIPPTIGGLILCYRGRYLLGGSLTGVFMMMQLSSNHPQMTYYFAFVMLGFAISSLIDLCLENKIKQWVLGSAIALGACVLAVGANLPNLYNTYKYAKETKRTQSELTPLPSGNPDYDEAAKADLTGGMPKSQIVGWSYGRSEMFSLLVPNVKGGASAKPVAGQMHPTSMGDVHGARDVSGTTGYLLQFFSQYFNDSEGTNGPVYVGAIIFALFLVGCVIVRGPAKWMLIILTLLSILLALGRNFSALTDFMIYHFPLYNKFRAVESILVIAEFTIPLLAILALAQILTPKGETAFSLTGTEQPSKADKDEWEKVAVVAGFGVSAFICLIAIAAPAKFGSVITSQDYQIISLIQQQDPSFYPTPLIDTLTSLRHGMIKADASRSLLFLVLGAALILAFFRARKKQDSASMARLVAAGIAILVTVDLCVVDKRYLSHESFVAGTNSKEVPQQLQPDAIDQEILNDGAGNISYRVMDIPGFHSADRSYLHKTIGGYHAAKLNRYDDLISRRMQGVLSYGYIPELRIDTIAKLYAQENPDIVARLLADYRVLDMLNARYIITGDPNEPLCYNDHALGNAWLVGDILYAENADQEMAALGSIDPATQAVADKKFLSVLGQDVVQPTPGDTIKLVSYAPDKLVYDTESTADAIGVFSEVYFPWGWKATIDGKPAELARVNYVLRAMRIPAGKHTVEMVFDPDSIHVTVSIAYACVTLLYLMLAGAIFMAFWRMEEAPAPSPAPLNRKKKNGMGKQA